MLTPENTGLMEPIGKLRREKARDEANHPVLAALREVARETGAWLLLGSLAVDISREPGVSEGERRLANRSYLIDAAGAVVAHYDKIHMFDVDLAGGESYRESNAFRPGDRAVLAPTPWGVLGMTVCYDLRFPQLYRALAQAGADFLAIPSAFTVPTGKAHWQVLLRARAIETGCIRARPGAVRRARRGKAHLWPLADRRSMGRSHGRRRRTNRHRQRPYRHRPHRRGAPDGALARPRPSVRRARNLPGAVSPPNSRLRCCPSPARGRGRDPACKAGRVRGCRAASPSPASLRSAPSPAVQERGTPLRAVQGEAWPMKICGIGWPHGPPVPAPRSR